MATLVCFHAHPDDETITTGGTMAKAAAEGHRVVLVVATRGEVGEVADGFLAPGETLADRRTAETEAAADVLGVSRLEFLGYRDSGMMGEPTNDHPDCFWQADVDEAAVRLGAILADERPLVLTCYDDHGNYGHPDHIQVHRVGLRAAEVAGVERVYEATSNRDEIRHDVALAVAEAAREGREVEVPGPAELDGFGTPAARITTAVDVRDFTGCKRRALAAHRSQIDDDSFFLALPDEQFAAVFGTEWFVRVDGGLPPGVGPDRREVDLFDDAVSESA